MKLFVFGCLVPGVLLAAYAPVSAQTVPNTVKEELTAQMQALAQTIKDHDLLAQFAFHTPDFTRTFLNAECVKGFETKERKYFYVASQHLQTPPAS